MSVGGAAETVTGSAVGASRTRLPPSLMIGLGLLALIVFCAVFAPWLTPYNPIAQSLRETLQPPSAAHWLGRDHDVALFEASDRLGGNIRTETWEGCRVEHGPNGWLEGVDLPFTDVWWGSGVWNGEMLRIESNRPITVLNGDYDHPHFGAFVPFVLAHPTLPPVAVADVDPLETGPGGVVTFDGTASYDQDSFPGGKTVRHEWDLDIDVDTSGDGIPDNDIDATGAVVSRRI